MLRALTGRSCRQVFNESTEATFFQNRRWFGLSTSKLNVQYPGVKEIEIPVPWGKIAARHWNCKPGTRPVLCVHGWKDNAASFDPLLPLLINATPQYQFLAIDLPGHGRSSHFPPGMLYLLPDIFLLFRRILKHFGWEKIDVLAHSMGSYFSFMFAGTYPGIVEKFVALDALTPFVQTRKDSLEIIHKITSEMLAFDDKLQNYVCPTYPFDEILQKLLRGHMGQMTEEACRTLMTRGTEEHPLGSGRYKFSHDIRVQYMPFQGISSRQVAFVMENFRSDLLLIKAEQGLLYTVKHIEENQDKWLAYDADGNPKGNIISYASVPGNHHNHLIHPEDVLPHIAGFLLQNRLAVPKQENKALS